MLKEMNTINDMALAMLDGYFAGTLPAGMAQWLETRMNGDEALRKEIEAYRISVAALHADGRRRDAALTHALQSMSRDEMEQLLNTLRRKSSGAEDNEPAVPPATPAQVDSIPAVASQAPKKGRMYLWRILTAAALVCGVWFGARLFYGMQKAQSTADTYIAVKGTESASRTKARGGEQPMVAAHDYSLDTVSLAEVAPTYDEMDMVVSKAQYLLQNECYKEAIALLEPLYKANKDQHDIGLMLATAYVKAHETEKANDVLQALNRQYAGDPEVEALINAYVD